MLAATSAALIPASRAMLSSKVAGPVSGLVHVGAAAAVPTAVSARPPRATDGGVELVGEARLDPFQAGRPATDPGLPSVPTAVAGFTKAIAASLLAGGARPHARVYGQGPSARQLQHGVNRVLCTVRHDTAKPLSSLSCLRTQRLHDTLPCAKREKQTLEQLASTAVIAHETDGHSSQSAAPARGPTLVDPLLRLWVQAWRRRCSGKLLTSGLPAGAGIAVEDVVLVPGPHPPASRPALQQPRRVQPGAPAVNTRTMWKRRRSRCGRRLGWGARTYLELA
mmetsp:Transcript_62107/g.166655  ORF Transcript_62107/g.166655 Transcript_62107/m.166655 type:complete len:280 (+) Transcript_62107:2165-3004(+)